MAQQEVSFDDQVQAMTDYLESICNMHLAALDARIQRLTQRKINYRPLKFPRWEGLPKERSMAEPTKIEPISPANLVPKQEFGPIEDKEAPNDEASCVKLESSLDNPIVEIEESKVTKMLPNNQMSPIVDDPPIGHLISTNQIFEESIESFTHQGNLERMDILGEKAKDAQSLNSEKLYSKFFNVHDDLFLVTANNKDCANIDAAQKFEEKIQVSGSTRHQASKANNGQQNLIFDPGGV